jgi:ubiquinone/menaquinone biosynthesis C-methylase UbiE
MMKDNIDYKRQTLDAYKTENRAREYQEYNSRNWTWGRFVTYLEQRIVRQELSARDWKEGDRLLDIPCGTGILGPTIKKFPFVVTASDISYEMMDLARGEYDQKNYLKFIQSDITHTPFEKDSYPCIVTLGFLHRVPEEIKWLTLKELHRISSGLVIFSFSSDSFLQKVKRNFLSLITRRHVPAPCPEGLGLMLNRVNKSGFRVIRVRPVLPFFSADTLIVMEKC